MVSKCFVIDLAEGAELQLQPAQFADFLKSHFKIVKNGVKRTGVLGEKVTIAVDGSKVIVNTKNYDFAKRYLRYLTKKFLSVDYRNIFRVLATGKNSYALRIYASE